MDTVTPGAETALAAPGQTPAAAPPPLPLRDQTAPAGIPGEGAPAGGSQLRIGSLCSGYEGLGMAVHQVLGGKLAWVADNDPGAAAILAHRFPAAKNLGDISETDWAAAEPVDILTAGFPCQPISLAGKRLGEADERWLWPEVVRAVRSLRPGLVFLENVAALVVRGLAGVTADLAAIGYVGTWLCVRASDAGAPHQRKRIFILAWPAADATATGEGRGRVTRGARRRPAAVWHEAGAQPGDRHGAPAQDPDRAAGGERRQPAPGQAPGGWPRADAGRPGGVRAPADAPGDGRHEGRTEPAGEFGGPDAAERGHEPWSIGPGESRCPSCGCPDYAHDAGGFCAGPCGGNCADPELGRPDGPWNSFEDGTDPAEVRASALAHSEGIRHRDTGPQGERGIPAAAVAGAAADTTGSARRIGDGDDVLAGCRADRRGQTAGGSAPADSHGGGRGPDERNDALGQSDLDWRAYGPAIGRWEAVTGCPAPRPTEPGRTGQRLSPAFVEWLMGLPAGWVTDVPGLSRNAQLKALGNGVVPAQAALALSLLLDRVRTEVAA